MTAGAEPLGLTADDDVEGALVGVLLVDALLVGVVAAEFEFALWLEQPAINKVAAKNPTAIGRTAKGRLIGNPQVS